jgi:cation:H+ antiporter
MLHVVILLACAVAIYLSCEWFVNAVEWLGLRLKVGPLAVGTVLAAFGTALPESVVTFVAVVLGSGPDQKDIGVGAAMGGPLALATAAYGVTGFMLLTRRRKAMAAVPAGGGAPPRERADNHGHTRKLARDQRWFLVIFVVKVGLGLVTFAFKPWLGLLFFAAYGVYFWRELRAEDTGDERLGDTRKLARDQRWFLVIFAVKVTLGLVTFAFKPWLGLLFFAAYGVYFWRELRAESDPRDEVEIEPLKLQPRRDRPATWAVITQATATLVIIFVASQLFVHALEKIGPMLGLPAAVTALLLAPIATELPEIMNAIIWVRQGKTSLALANISGAMMIQATVPSGIGLIATPWRFDTPLLLAGVATVLAVGYLLLLFRTNRVTPVRLILAVSFYLLFAAALAVTIR